MSRPPYQTYPHHHPHHGRPFIEVHDHDVLSGRGVSMAQHPGNERFRSLVNTRQDETYCSNFTTSEKRALAEEIIAHIRSLNPPGRFLKRTGRSQSARGLKGPWEELSHRECVKKTCQALRDCNRQDRKGYAAHVDAPSDVKHSAGERAKAGLTLKQHAAAAVAKANPSTLNPHAYNLNPALMDQRFAAPPATAAYAHQKTGANNISPTRDALSPSVEQAAVWLKKPRTEEQPPAFVPASAHPPAPVDPVLSTMSSQVSTPAPLVAPVPVSTTPPSSHSQHHAMNLSVYHPSDHLAVSHHTGSPQIPSPAAFHHVEETHAPAPYSPVVLLNDDVQGVDANEGIDPRGHLDPYPTDHGQHFDEHHPFSTTDPSGHQANDMLQESANGAVPLEHDHLHHRRNNSLTLLHTDDGTHEPLSISDL